MSHTSCICTTRELGGRTYRSTQPDCPAHGVSTHEIPQTPPPPPPRRPLLVEALPAREPEQITFDVVVDASQLVEAFGEAAAAVAEISRQLGLVPNQLAFEDVEPGFYQPGSDLAVEHGCRCPRMDNSYGRGYLGVSGVYVTSETCSLHWIRIEEVA